MELWLRTKKSMIRVDGNLFIEEWKKNDQTYWHITTERNGKFTLVASYSTENQAVSVLDEIQKALSTIILTTPTDNYTDKDLKRAREFCVLSSPSQTIFDTGCVVYTMPEDV